MKLPTLAEIEEMKRNGCEAETLAIARAAYEHGQEGLELCAVIEAAFADAKLGDGVGLSQGNGMDDYKDEAACAALRADDEKEDWRNLTTEALNRYNWSLSYFDAEGRVQLRNG